MSDTIPTATVALPETQATWFYSVADQQRGPVTEKELVELCANGEVNPGTLVWRQGFPNWIRLAELGVNLPMATQASQGMVLNYAKGEDDPTNIFGWWWYVVSKNYASMRGRARRKEFWSFALVKALIIIPLVVLAIVVDGGSGRGPSGPSQAILVVTLCVYLGLIIPYICAIVRRLHDSGKSGWYFFVTFVPYVGGIILLILLALDSEQAVNRYGPNPKSALRDRA